jgi:hypothetical protein
MLFLGAILLELTVSWRQFIGAYNETTRNTAASGDLLCCSCGPRCCPSSRACPAYPSTSTTTCCSSECITVPGREGPVCCPPGLQLRNAAGEAEGCCPEDRIFGLNPGQGCCPSDHYICRFSEFDDDLKECCPQPCAEDGTCCSSSKQSCPPIYADRIISACCNLADNEYCYNEIDGG